MPNSTRGNIKQVTATDYRKRVCQAMNFISRHLDRDLSLDEIARAACFSKHHFHRIFKAVVGETVAAFTRRLRLEFAANRLLSNPEDEITKIALDCGFSSSQNFAKAFRQHFGTSPSGYRNSICRFEISGDSFQQAWEDAFAWLVNSGYECDEKPCYELYHNNAEEHPEGKWIFDICIPLKSRN